jgi:AcrR family transcriptional regulator
MSRKRMLPTERKREILAAALRVATRPGGWANLTRADVAREAGCVASLITAHFGTMIGFRRAVMRAAIAGEHLAVIAQGIVAGHTCAIKAPVDLKVLALNSLTTDGF